MEALEKRLETLEQQTEESTACLLRVARDASEVICAQ